MGKAASRSAVGRDWSEINGRLLESYAEVIGYPLSAIGSRSTDG
jgi:hypothetical protein